MVKIFQEKRLHVLSAKGNMCNIRRCSVEKPLCEETAIDLIHTESIRFADAVPLEDFKAVVEYAKWLESELENHKRRACKHVMETDEGKIVCSLAYNVMV
jgi:hypothetical protein